MVKRLYKSNGNKMLDGVCGGVAEYLGFDATVVRLAWVASFLAGGLGFWAYIICMLIIPREPGYPEAPPADKYPGPTPGPNAN